MRKVANCPLPHAMLADEYWRTALREEGDRDGRGLVKMSSNPFL